MLVSDASLWKMNQLKVMQTFEVLKERIESERNRPTEKH